jgi:hypothetical protein
LVQLDPTVKPTKGRIVLCLQELGHFTVMVSKVSLKAVITVPYQLQRGKLFR